MYGSSDDHWDSEYFIMRAVALEQNKLLQKILTDIKTPELMREVALAIVDFSARIQSAMS